MMEKIFLISGTRKGIGKYLAEYYLERGNIVVGCSRGEGSVKHSNYSHYQVDVSDEKAVTDLVRKIRREFGRIDVLLNNAGIAAMNHFITTPYKSVQEIYATNVFGSFLLMREVSKVMMKNKNGRIVNFSSVATPLRLEGEAIYASSKAAVVSLTEIGAVELAKFGITVNAIGPTPLLTDLIRTVPKDKINDLLKRQAIERLAQFEDVSNVTNFFIDDKSDFITGQVIYLGGVNR